ncbi:ATP-binding protein [Actinoplanes sp. NPDC049265]|uniref:ATP-binding protein n=1 Tax=Actinoplanes sp. NPDC049265 TaxID=3363902 RepID=UPI00371579F8
MVAGGRFEYRVLGPVEALFSGVPFSVGGPRHRALLAALLLRANSVVSVDRLADTLWEQPRSGTKELLYGRISEIRLAMRKAGGGPAPELETHTGGYLLRVPDDALDARRFERLVESGLSATRSGRHDEAAEILREALGLWRGPALAELAHLPEAAAEIARLDESRMRAVEARIGADLARGRHREVIAELIPLVAEHPLNEHLWAQLILARYRSDQVGDALATFDSARRQLAEQLGTDPGEPLRRLHQQVLRQDPALDPAPAGPLRPRLPARALTSFVGRDPELARLRDLLRTGRLVTVTGIGGIGKTRVAVEAASRAGVDGGTVWLVELAALAQPDLLADAVGDVLGVPPHGTRPRAGLVEEYLRDRDGLLILDNCEHLVDAAAGFALRILAAAPGLRILATSRERLGVTGEILFPLTGLALPAAGPDRPEAAGASAAVRLFVERAGAVDPGFALTGETTAAVVTICRELDGLPLAIELAAAHANAFTVTEMASRLDDRFALLAQGSRTAEPRHRTLQAVIDWSYRLLDADERRLLARLSVFAGRFDLAWAEQLAADLHPSGRVAGLIAALVDKSLLLRESGRYRMLETVRAYGMERLAEQGELASVRDRHATLVAAMADQLGRGFLSSDRDRSVRLLDATMEQFRSAMEWTVANGDAGTALRIASRLTTYWHITGQYAVGRRWLRYALDAGGESSPAIRAWALGGLLLMTSLQGDLPAATAAGEAAAALFQHVGNRRGYGATLRGLATAEAFAGNLDRADALLAEALAVAREAAWPWLLGWVYAQLGLMQSFRGDWERTAELAAEAEKALVDADDPEVLAFTWLLSAEVARNLAGPTAGAERLCDALRLLDQVAMQWSITMGLHYASLVFADLDRPDRELVLLSAGSELRRRTGRAFFATMAEHQEKRLAHLRVLLSAEEFEAGWEAGRLRPVSRIIDEVCRELAPPENLDIVAEPV